MKAGLFTLFFPWYPLLMGRMPLEWPCPRDQSLDSKGRHSQRHRARGQLSSSRLWRGLVLSLLRCSQKPVVHRSPSVSGSVGTAAGETGNTAEKIVWMLWLTLAGLQLLSLPSSGSWDQAAILPALPPPLSRLSLCRPS